jgi:hypothetical protein
MDFVVPPKNPFGTNKAEKWSHLAQSMFLSSEAASPG